MVDNKRNTKEKRALMKYSVSDIGNLCSIIGLIITVITFFVAANVNRKINKIQKIEKDISYFNKRVNPMIADLKDIQALATGTEDIEKIFGVKQQAKIKCVITVIDDSWNVLLQHETKIGKKLKIHSWNKKMKKIMKMYEGIETKNRRELISFLTELITFLEKENKGNE